MTSEAKATSAVEFTGDATSFARVVGAFETEMVRFCLRFLADADLARDAAQEVFLTLWRERDRYVEQGKLRYYLLRVARLRCLALCKKRSSQAVLPPEHVEEVVATGADAEALADAAVLHACIARLRPKFAELVVLRHLEGLSLAEVSEVTGLREGTIKSRLSRGMEMLKKELLHVGR